MRIIFFDASALAKRYSTEVGAHFIDLAFSDASHAQLWCAYLGSARSGLYPQTSLQRWTVDG